MINQEDLPVWARILLGIPGTVTETGEGSDPKQQGRECERRTEDHEYGMKEQDAVVFNPAVDKPIWRWQALLRPVPGEF